MAEARRPVIGFCTFGMFIIDEIDYGDTRGSASTIMGGAGLYAALGARLAAGCNHATAVSFTIDKGSDFPEEFQALIESWKSSVIFRSDMNRLTTRAWNGYGPNQHRDFKYLTPKRRLEVESLTDEQALASTFHMVCSPDRCMTLVKGLRSRRKVLSSNTLEPIVVWEPIPDLCTPAELDNLQEAATYVDIISPNGEELADFFASGTNTIDRKDMVMSVLKKCRPNPKQTVVVRDGADGSRLYMKDKIVHLRAFHQEADNVVDPTGGGNTYLGGLAMGLSTLVSPSADQTSEALLIGKGILSTTESTMLNAILHATISASFAIEQVGLPSLRPDPGDLWNGASYADRFHEYLQREAAYLLNQLEIGQTE